MSILDLQFAAGRRFVEAVGQAIWVQDIHPKLTAKDYLKRCGEIAQQKQLPCTIEPREVSKW